MGDVSVKLAIGNLSIEVSGESAYVDKKFDELVSRFFNTFWKPSGSEQSAPTPATAETDGKKKSAAEFLRGSSAKSQIDRALVLGYYLEKFETASNFTSTELAHLGQTVRQPFTNASDTVAKLGARGLMMSAGDKDGQRAYALTASGETFVETLLESRK
jgi:hypothetical protein